MGRGLRACSLLTVLAVGGCAVHVVGLVRLDDARPTVVQLDGTEHRLVLDGSSRPLAGLEDHLVEVDGQRLIGRTRVTGWRVLEGPHGLAVWVGPLVAWGVQIGIEDHTSGALYFVDEEAARILAPYLGQVVAVEGYVDGPHRVRVLHYLTLAALPPPG